MMRRVNICTIVKNEGLYLAEWIEYHLLKSVNKFFIYEHGSTDNTKEILAKYNDVVTVIDWSAVPVPAQRVAYSHCIQTIQQEKIYHEDWLACIDVDEFIITAGHTHSIPKALHQIEIQAGKDTVGVITANWQLYGSSGLDEYDDRLVIERFTQHDCNWNQHVKCFVLPECSLGNARDVHSFYTDKKYITSAGLPGVIAYPFQDTTGPHKIWINHYLTKSKEEYRKRCALGRVDIKAVKDFEENWKANDINDCDDKDFMGQFIEPIKTSIKKRFNEKLLYGKYLEEMIDD